MMKGGLSCCQHLIIVTQKEATVSAQKCNHYEPSFIDTLQAFEAMLCFDKWLRKDLTSKRVDNVNSVSSWN
jgi:hypothetical protein